ncbi:MAG: hypothetical protein KBA26_11215 [Candidatus Delongbacteria bacterium]|nr:hypothetical protein [Candidatus Delongbacteria bacterium]
MVDPIALQDLFSKTQLAEKVTQTQKQQPESDHRQFSYQLQQKIEQDRTVPRELTPKDENLIRRQDKQPDHQAQDQEKKDEKPESPEPSSSDEAAIPPNPSGISPSHIDIRI